MTSEFIDNGVPSPHEESGRADQANAAGRSAGMGRRFFLKGAASIAGAAAFLGSTEWASAGNGWSIGLSDVPKDKLLEIYTKMQTSRIWETAMKDQFLAGTDQLYGAFHPYIGEEAVANGVMANLNDDDYIASTHRGHGHLIAKGGDLDQMSAEIYFRKTGYNKGFGGSMHMTDASKGILGMNGIVGPTYLISAGAAYGALVKGTKQVAVAFGGDGSVNNGWYYSGLRNAALYNLPLIAVVENNGYQISMPQERTNSLRNLSSFGAGVEIPHETVNGMDVLAVYAVAKRAVDRARAGGGPTLIEAKTYRFYDHAGWAGAKTGTMGAFGLPYRSDQEVRDWIQEDPIPRFRNQLISNGVATEDDLNKIDADVQAKVDKSVEMARAAPLPDPKSGLENVYATGTVEATQFLA